MTREEREEVSYWRLIQWRLHVGRETAGERPLRFLPVLPVRADAAAVRIRIGAAVIEVASGLIQACCAGWLRHCGDPPVIGLSLSQATAVFVAREAVGLRKSIDGLALWGETSLPASPLSGSVFVFFNRQRDKMKLLFIATSVRIDIANSRAEPD